MGAELGIGESESVLHRNHRWLTPFLQEIEIDAVLHQNPITFRPGDEPAVLLQVARDNLSKLPPLVGVPISELPDVLDPKASEVASREQFQREYAAKAAVGFGIVDLSSLLTPQPLADMDYVRDLEQLVPADGDLAGAFDYAFPMGTLAEPAVIGNTVTFTSPAPNVYANPIPSYRSAPGGYEVVIRVEPRPNYLYVAQIAGLGGRLLLVNGVHHVLALLKKGRTASPALIRPANGIDELGLPKTTMFNHIGDWRPPLVRDFLDTVAVPVLRRQTAVATTVASQIGQVIFPMMGEGQIASQMRRIA